jgi:hypothetical protein
VGVRVVGRAALLPLNVDPASTCTVDAKPAAYRALLGDAVATSLGPLFTSVVVIDETSREPLDIVFDLQVVSLSYRAECGSKAPQLFTVNASLRAYDASGMTLWQTARETSSVSRNTMPGGGGGGLLGAVVRKVDKIAGGPWLTNEVTQVLAQVASDWTREFQASNAAAGVAPAPATGTTSPVAEPARAAVAPAPAWLRAIQKSGLSHEARLAVLELSGPLKQSVLMMLADEVRSGALKATAGQGCSVMTRESMAMVLKEMGIKECKEGECEVETARNIGADLVISGAVEQIEGSFVATLKLHETARGTLIGSERATAPSALGLIDALKGTTTALFK